ncbi:MAG TPA: hypothetical protein VFS67_17495 [Polyangiaceae bacterium]|nr:hypothetical protein [Polyangiaceae bacterium]
MAGVPLARLTATWRAALGLMVAFGLGCAGTGESGVTYTKDVSQLFSDCVLCHQPGAPFGPDSPFDLSEEPDVLHPYAPEDGLVTSIAHWKRNHPDGLIPDQLVLPGQPDDSFLINKISDPALNLLPNPDINGVSMPFQIKRVTTAELAAVEQWVTSGAQDDDFYRTTVAPIFVSPNGYTYSKCDLCHFAGATTPMDLRDPFGPDGAVGVPSRFRSDMLRVAPGDPDGSLLVQRMRQSAGDNLPTSEFGAPMPKPTPNLSEAQVAIVRQWIVEGARP